jgi:hypothetical protein
LEQKNILLHLSTDLEAAMALIHDTIEELCSKWRIKNNWE